ncbi:hypothetical protein HMPREF9137_0628 [Prevotella denticola F0289]|nr:hypothetical protein HMPREF9137_0628 [Prevotella denticola F0289]
MTYRRAVCRMAYARAAVGMILDKIPFKICESVFFLVLLHV